MKTSLLAPLKWLLPGMRIKRWLFLSALGLLTLSMGLMLLTTNRAALLLEMALVELVQSWTGWRPPSQAVDWCLVLVGLAVMLWAANKWFSSVYNAAVPYQRKRLVELLYERRQLGHGLKIVALGGGTGLSTLLRGLKNHTSNVVAIVTVSDDGGSSGRLSKELGMLPPGDLRNCLVALADDESLLSELFQYRFRDGQGLEGHSFGNLFLAALTEISGDFEVALKRASQILATRGRVLPATLCPVTLCARLKDGRTVSGESDIPKAHGRVSEVYLEPRRCRPPAEVLKVLAEADLIVLGPGSLYTSVIPNLLVEGVAEAIRASSAPKVYVCNVMTQPGETDGYTAADHLEAIHRHVGGPLVDYAIVNVAPPNRLLGKYEKEGAHPVKPDMPRLRNLGVEPIPANLMNEDSLVRHDPVTLAESILEVMARHRSSGEMAAVPDRPALRAVK